MKQEGDNIRVNNWKVDFQHYPHTHSLDWDFLSRLYFHKWNDNIDNFEKILTFWKFSCEKYSKWEMNLDNNWIINPTLCHLEGESLY